MKRSEMTLLMYAWMLEPPKNISQIHDGGQQMYKMMEFILGKMEEAGILPPHVELNDCDELCKPEELFEFANLDGNFVWEKE